MVRKCLRGGLLLLLCAASLVVDAAPNPSELPDPDYLADSPERSLETAIELTEYNYEDDCERTGVATWNLVHDAKEANVRLWKDAMIRFAQTKRTERGLINDTLNETSEKPADSSPLGYKLSLVSKPAEALLNDEDYDKLLSFVGANRVSRAKARYSRDGQDMSREEVDSLLSRNGKAGDKLEAWTSWHRQFNTQVDGYLGVLQLAQKAALENDQPDVRSYWEMLSGEPRAYEDYKYKFDHMSELRARLVKFAGQRLAKKYGVEMRNDRVPAHLLGSLMGYDWTPLALDLVADPKIVEDLRKNLWRNNLRGEVLYLSANKLARKFFNKVATLDTFKDSDFRGECPAKVVNFCKYGKMRISSCNEASLSNYLRAHRDVAKIIVHQMSNKVPVLNDANRYSVLEEGVAEFLSIVAASPAALRAMQLIDDAVGREEATLASLTITALDVLPRLAYYLTADRWRLEAIERNESSVKQLLSEFWSSRMQNDFVYSESEEVPTFLSDDHIVNNRPYLSKVLGIALGFQLYENVMKSTDVRHDLDSKIIHPGLIHMVQNNSENWKSLLEQYMDITEIRVQPMNDYFEELDYYYKEYVAPREDKAAYDYNAKELELERTEREYRRIANTPTTTTTSSTTTSTTTTTAKPRANHNRGMVKSFSKSDNALSTTEKPARREEENEVRDEEYGSKSKVGGTNKAVWAVAAVLIATVTICLIAIFGRKRCSKTPKNRRYV